MRSFKTVFMRGGTSKGCIFHREDLPENQDEWDSIFLQVMGNPDPKQIDGMGGTVSSNNKIVIVWSSKESGVDIEYLVGQVIVGKNQVDYKSNCGNMTAAVGPFAVEEGMVPVSHPVTLVRTLNRNTNKRINITVPCKDGTFAQEGNCRIAGIDGTGAELKVEFLDPAGAKTGRLFPTGNRIDEFFIDGWGKIKATILDVSNPMVIISGSDLEMSGRELPEEINHNDKISSLLEKIRGQAAYLMGFVEEADKAETESPAVPKIGFFTAPVTFKSISGEIVEEGNMDLNMRVISVSKCHKACPLTSAGAVGAAAVIDGTVIQKGLRNLEDKEGVRIGNPSGVMTVYPELNKQDGEEKIISVAVQRTARRIMEGTIYIPR